MGVIGKTEAASASRIYACDYSIRWSFFDDFAHLIDSPEAGST
jgi:hypothetical protein